VRLQRGAPLSSECVCAVALEMFHGEGHGSTSRDEALQVCLLLGRVADWFGDVAPDRAVVVAVVEEVSGACCVCVAALTEQ
jgi:hypothetical protein